MGIKASNTAEVGGYVCVWCMCLCVCVWVCVGVGVAVHMYAHLCDMWK